MAPRRWERWTEWIGYSACAWGTFFAAQHLFLAGRPDSGMSLDGFIAGPNAGPHNHPGDGGPGFTAGSTTYKARASVRAGAPTA